MSFRPTIKPPWKGRYREVEEQAMKRFLTFTAVLLAGLAWAAAPASAIGIPHNDYDPDHWTDVINFGDLNICDAPCSFTGTSTDYTYAIGGNPVLTCGQVTIDYEIDNPSIDSWFAFFDSPQGTPQCFDEPRPQMACAYSPSGFQDPGDIELWLRDSPDSESSDTIFGKFQAEHYVEDSTGGRQFVADGLVIDEWPVDTIEEHTLTASATIEFDQTVGLESDSLPGFCWFPELQS